MKLLRFILLFSLFPTSAFAAGRVQCSHIQSRVLHRLVGYCVMLPSGYDSQKTRRFDVLYFLHGLGGDQQLLINSGMWNLVDDLQTKGKIEPIVIITPQAWDSFYVNSRDRKMLYEDFFIGEFMPAMEKRFRIGKTRAHRAISGISMGGYGALRFAFKYPQLFSTVAAHSAALIADLPPGAAAATEAGNFSYLGQAFGSPLSVAYWNQNTPFIFARRNSRSIRGLRIYFDCGRQDDYGFDAGAKDLDALLDKLHVKHEFHLYPGNHGWAYFARHIPKSLEFVSKGFTEKH